MAVRCKVFGHQWKLKQRSNVIQFDDMGYPLRLFICECKYCMKSEQMWLDSTECKNDVVLQWSDDYYISIPPKVRSEMTNKEKFKDVFGLEIDDTSDCGFFDCTDRECKDCPVKDTNNWWNSEYKKVQG